MRTRTIIAVLVAFVITIALSAVWSASTVERDGDTDANVIEDSGSAAGNVSEPKKGNKVAHLVAAPFKALGKLFGHKNDHKLERMTAKDAERFQSVGVDRVGEAVADQKLVSGSA